MESRFLASATAVQPGPAIKRRFSRLPSVLLASLVVLGASAVAQQPEASEPPPGGALPPDLDAIRAQFLANLEAEAAAEDKVGGKWRGVPRITGQATIQYEVKVDEAGFSPSLTSSNQEETVVRFRLERDAGHGTAQPFWRATHIDLSGGTSDQAMLMSGDAHMLTTHDARFRGPPPDVGEMTLSLDTESGHWQMGTPGHTKDPYFIRIHNRGHRAEGMRWVGVNESETRPDNRVQSFLFEGTIPDQPGVVTATGTLEGLLAQKTTRTYRKTGRIVFWPEFDDYTLEVTIKDYASWRPLGIIGAPDKPGSYLEARAVVVPKGNSPPTPVKAIRFTLIDVSREPGVCLNSPLGATDRNPDLKLAATSDCPGAISEENQRLEITRPLADAHRRPYATARIESFDFGGRATLRVTCELLDGREIVGELKGDGPDESQDLIRLPKTEGPGWIAAAWKREHEVAEFTDTDDSERVEGQEHDGDGFTLYEEYRGWVVNGGRVEGDARRKDFFVLNLIGPDASNGLELFEKVSQLLVHSGLKPSEMSETTRLMNGNHRDAPQRVRQHGVWIKSFPSPETLGGTGAYTRLNRRGVSGRPGLVDGIGLLPRHHERSEFNQPYNLPRFFSLLAYDRAIAHELLHSVGVEHHGEGDSSLGAKWVSPTHPRNTVGRPHFRELLGRDLITLRNELGHDLAAQYMPLHARDREISKQWYWDKWLAEGREYVAARQGMDRTWKTAEDYAEYMLEEMGGLMMFGTIGAPGGEHSGEQDCLMRYYFARFYPATGQDATYYLVTEGTEPFGLVLCRSRAGTGVNAPDYKPQSRYAAAGKNGGSCFSQICPNDAIPPKTL